MSGLLDLILVCFFFFVVACQSHHEDSQSEVQEVKIDELQKDFKIPARLWSLMAGAGSSALTREKAHGSGHSSGEQAGHGGQAGASESSGHGDSGGHEKANSHGPAEAGKDSQIIFVPMKVHLIEKNEGILKSTKTTISLPRGGGLIDMSDWTTGERGTYYIKFEMEEVLKPEEQRAYFLSQTKKRKIDDEIIGMGCNKFVDLGSKYFDLMKEKGIAVNTTRNRDVTVSGGRWFFVAKEAGKTYISHVTIADVNHKDLYCEDFAWNVN